MDEKPAPKWKVYRRGSGLVIRGSVRHPRIQKAEIVHSYVAVGLFCGLWASELAPLDWAEVSLPERTIEVTAAKAKTGTCRNVTISDNLAAWLTSHIRAHGRCSPGRSRAPLGAPARSRRPLTGPRFLLPQSFRTHLTISFHTRLHPSPIARHSNREIAANTFGQKTAPSDAPVAHTEFSAAASARRPSAPKAS